MSEYLSKKAVLGWFNENIKDQDWPHEMRYAFKHVRKKILSGAFDADTSEIQRLRAALEWIVECGTDYQSINKARNALCEIKGGESGE